MLQIRNILHPTDLSPNSRTAFAIACALASDYQAKLVVLYVHEPPMPIGELVPPEPPGTRDALWRELRALTPPKPVNIEYLLRDGRPLDGILTAAQEIGADLIVLGTHGRSGIRRMLLGSVAETVVRDAPCPVLAIKSDGKAPAA